MSKPPLGLVPKNIYETITASERIKGILDAMERYSKAKEPIPEEWVTELRKRLYKRGNNAK